MKRSRIKRTPFRRKPTRSTWGPGAASIEDLPRRLWKEGLGRCVVCPAEGGVCQGRVQGHHVVSKQALKKRGLLEYLWDRRNRMAVCEHRHESHTNGTKRIPWRLLTAEHLAFADELELRYLLERVYPREQAA